MTVETLPQLFQASVREHAARPAIIEGDVSLTYAALEARVGSLARTLSDLGVRQGARVAMLLPNGADFVTGYFAIATLGAVVVPLNDGYQQDELRYFLEVCDVSVLLTNRAHEPLCRRVLADYDRRCDLLLVEALHEEHARTAAPLEALIPQIDPSAPVMYQFSSGSTGRPKQIGRNHHNVLFEMGSLHETLSITPEDRFVGVAPFSHVNGLMRSMMASITAGACLHPMATFKRRALAELIERQRVSVFIAVPFMFSMLAEANFRRVPDFSSLRLCISASAPMPRKSNALFRERFGLSVRQLYGSTETGTISANLREDPEATLDSVGTPVRGVTVEVFREDGSRAQPEELGEFAVRSPGMISGYEALPEINREAFRDGYFFTGDLGTASADGMLYLRGRKKFFINKGGYKIDPAELEQLLEEHPGVAEVAVVGMPTAYGDEQVKAVVVRAGECTPEALIAHCSGRVADFKIPAVVEFRDALPKSPTGKLRRRLLIEE